MTRNLLIFAVLSVTLYYATALEAPIRASTALSGGGFFNITISSSSNQDTLLVKIIKVDENGNVLFQTTYDDAVEYYDGHMTSLITRRGFSFRFANGFGCYRRCMSVSLVRESLPLLGTYEYPRCGGDC